LQNAGFKWCNLKLSRPEVLLRPDILRNALQIMLMMAVIQYLLQVANDLSVN